MFKIKVVKKVGELESVVEVETDSQDMVLAILRHNDVISIDSYAPNRNVDNDWHQLAREAQRVDNAWQQLVREAQRYGLPMQPFTVTC